MGILRADRITGLGGANAIKGSVEMRGAQNMRAYVTNDNADFNLGSSDFTIECWYNPGGTTGTASDLDQDFLMLWNNTDSRRSWGLYYDASGSLGFIGSSDGTNSDMGSFHSYTFPDVNVWYHLAAVRISNTISMYVNGVLLGSESRSGSLYNNTQDNLVIGGQLSGTYYDNKIVRGFLSNVRLIIGDGIYTGAFTPPTNELTVTPNTKLLCCQSSGDILQEATGKTLIAYRSTVNDSFAKASTFTPNSPVGFSTTTDVGSQYGSTFDGFGSFATSTYMVPPGGNTRERNRGRALIMGGGSSPGSNNQSAIQYFNIQSMGTAQFFGNLTVARRALQGLSSSTRGLALGGFISPPATISDTIDFVTFASTGNGTDFGNLTSTAYAAATASNDTRGLFAGGYRPNNSAVVDSIDYVTIATAGNAADFGDLLSAKRANAGGSNTTRAVFAGGTYPAVTDVIQYVTIATTGNATDFGDLTVARDYPAGGGSSSTRTCFAGGRTPSNTNVIDFITTATTGNATDFGDSQSDGIKHGLVSNRTRGVICSDATITNTLEYITFATTGDALDFGDQGGSNTFPTVYSPGACSDSHGGLS